MYLEYLLRDVFCAQQVLFSKRKCLVPDVIFGADTSEDFLLTYCGNK